MIRIEIASTVQGGCLKLTGQATVQESGEVHRALVEACQEVPEAGNLHLDITALEAIDITFLQMVQAARTALAARKAHLALLGEPAQAVRDTACLAGLDGLLDTPQPPTVADHKE